MMATPARLAGVGAFVLGGLVLFAIGLFMIGDRQMAFAKRFTVYTEFTKITGLQPGAVVRVLGAKAGSIKQILPPNSPGEKFRVRLEIAESLHQLVRTDSVATIETEGLVGGSYLGIATGTDAAPRVSPNGTIAGKEPFEISDLVQQMGDSITKVNATIDEMKGDVQTAILSVADTMGSANALITDVSGDVKKMVTSGAKVTEDASQIAEGLRSGKGVIGKLITDDELYLRAIAIARQTEETAANANQVVELAKNTLEGFQAKDGPLQEMTADFKLTLEGARAAMVGFAENMDALKHNFLLRGFFNGRGYFDLDDISPAAYRQGVLTKGGRQVARVWLRSDALFEPEPDAGEVERLTAAGKVHLDSAFAPSLEHAASGVVIVEGYAQQGPLEARFLRSRARASLVRDYLLARFFLDAQTTGAMPLGADSPGSPGLLPWDGVAIAVILPKGTITGKEGSKTGFSASPSHAD
jgi:phospholipid/cholesterol/gamma-HCH transport system substrate-binding protein